MEINAFDLNKNKPKDAVGCDDEVRKRGICNEKENNERYDDKKGILQRGGVRYGVFFAGASAGRDHCVCGGRNVKPISACSNNSFWQLK